MPEIDNPAEVFAKAEQAVIAELAETMRNTAGERVLLGLRVEAPQSHRRGAEDLVAHGLWDNTGRETTRGAAVRATLATRLQVVDGRAVLVDQEPAAEEPAPQPTPAADTTTKKK